MKQLRINNRVLAIALHSKGLGFAVLEGPKRLIDYGGKKARGDKNITCLKKATKLIETYQPDVIVLLGHKGKSTRRGQGIQELAQEILKLAQCKKVKSRSFSRAQIIKLFSSSGATTKHQIASSIAKQFPELAFRLPSVRKPWMGEDERMNIFDAVAVALALFPREPN